MKYNKAEHVTDLLRQFLRSEGLETPLNEHRIISAWPEVVGHTVAVHTHKLEIHNQTLYAEIDTPVIRQELMMRRSQLVELLNQKAGARTIVDIHLI